MPLPIWLQVFQGRTQGDALGQLFQDIVQRVGNYDSSPGSFGPVSASDWYGAWAVQWDYNAGGAIIRNIYAALDVASGEVAHVRDVLAVASTSTATVLGGPGAPPNSAYIGDWETLINTYKRDVLAGMTDALSVVTTFTPTTTGGGFTLCDTAVTVVQTRASVLVTLDTFVLFGSDSTIIFNGEESQSMVNPEPPVVVVQQGGAFQQLVDAVNAITDQDIEVSLNRGAYTFSIKSKVTTG